MTGTYCGRLCQTEMTLIGTGCDSFRPFRNRLGKIELYQYATLNIKQRTLTLNT
ncbi:hypothetical protein DPMN_122631 [Dreissena polymorpha]|uniref:Uncharacterized protein n=1 Tax=Dreissena polymorpha TaxID=45954 RepID=A0A9D4JUN5_DREPO|nr:hypothetical protein DPMN_122631 [Dreissena polymorpha]